MNKKMHKLKLHILAFSLNLSMIYYIIIFPSILGTTSRIKPNPSFHNIVHHLQPFFFLQILKIAMKSASLFLQKLNISVRFFEHKVSLTHQPGLALPLGKLGRQLSKEPSERRYSNYNQYGYFFTYRSIN